MPTQSGNIDEPLCLDPKACNWRDCNGLTQAECSQVCLEKSENLCGECWEDGTCRDYSETKGCFAATTETAATCEVSDITDPFNSFITDPYYRL